MMMTSKAKSARRAAAASPESALLNVISAVGELLGDGLSEWRLVFDK